jgi:uncharacterized protein DUF6221
MRDDDFAAMMEFLRARLHEDETAARALKPGKNQDVAKLQARVLADVEAKRRLMDWVEEPAWRVKDEEERVLWKRAVMELGARLSREIRSPVIYGLVAAYDGHRDFYPPWRLAEDENKPRRGTPMAGTV